MKSAACANGTIASTIATAIPKKFFLILCVRLPAQIFEKLRR